MTLEANNSTLPDDDLNTTAPQSRPDVWEMPKPVFRKTSGKLPEGFVNDGFETVPSSPKRIETEETPATQAEPPDTLAPQAIPTNPTLKMILVVLGFAAMIAFIVVFLTVIYFFFLRTSE